MLEPSAGFVEEVRGQAQVPLRARDVDVAKVGGELGQELLDIGALAIPGDQPVNGEAVTIIPRPKLSS